MTASTGDKLSPTDLVALAKQAGGVSYTSRHFPDSTYSAFRPEALQAFADLIAAREREACAVECEDLANAGAETWRYPRRDCAEAIRARGTT